MTPAVSVIIPTFNRAAQVCRAVDSVLRQSFTNFELLVINDGSTDETLYWLQRYSDPRLRIFNTTNMGVAHARNHGVENSQSEWLCFLDSDDLWHHHKLSEQIRLHFQNPEILISHTEDLWIRQSVRVNKPKKYLTREGDIFLPSLKLCLIAASTVMLKKSLFLEMGGFDESFPTCEDYDLWLKITARHPVGFVKKILATKFGGHADQLSKKYPLMDQYRLRALENLAKNSSLSSNQRLVLEAEIECKINFIKLTLNEKRSLS